MPGNFVTVVATVQTSGAWVTSASNPWSPAPTWTATTITWELPTAQGLNPTETVSACFAYSGSQNVSIQFEAFDDLGFTTQDGSDTVTLQLSGTCRVLPVLEAVGVPCSPYFPPLPIIGGTGTTETGSQDFAVTLTDGPPSGTGILFIGNTKSALGLPLPLDVGMLLGDPDLAGCTLYQSGALSLPAPIGPDGHAAVPIPIPANPNAIGAELGMQWLVLDPTTLGLGFSALGKVTVVAP